MKQPQQINSQNYYHQPKKRQLSRFDYENENEEDENVQYIVRKKRKTPKTRIIYEEDLTDDENDQIDGDTEGKEAKIEESIEKKTFKKPNKKGVSKII